MSSLRQGFNDVGKVEASPTRSTNAACKSPPRHKITRDCPRVTVRFSRADYEKLQELADGASLAVYLRAKALDRELPKRKRGAGASIEDRAAVAQLLALLGQSRIANNLNQLAYQANVGSLVIEDQEKTKIEEAYINVKLMRQALMKALGMRE